MYLFIVRQLHIILIQVGVNNIKLVSEFQVVMPTFPLSSDPPLMTGGAGKSE